MMELLSNLAFAVAYNFMALIFYAAALFFVRKGKSFWYWYLIGLFLQGYSTFGTILGIIREPEVWRTPRFILAVVVFAALSLVFYLLLKQKEKRGGKDRPENRAADTKRR